MKGPPAVSRAIAARLRDAGAAVSGSGQAPLLPQARLSGPMPWVVAIMVLLTAVAAAGGIALGHLVGRASLDLAGGVTVQVLAADPAARARQANDALAVLRQAPGVDRVRLVPEREVSAMLEPWLGERTGDAAADLAIPVPALIDVELAGRADSARVAALRGRLAGVARDARVDAQSGWLKPVFGAIAALRWLAAGLIVLLALTTVAAVLLAARTALDRHRETVDVIHLLGGSDGQIARIFQRSVALDAAVGSAAGLALGAVVIALLARTFAALGSGLASGAALGWSGWAALALIPLVATALATLTARAAILGALRRML